LANSFRHPTRRDREELYRPPRGQSAVGSRFRRVFGAALGSLGSVVLVGFILISWAAHLKSCVYSVGRGRDAALAPRTPDLKSAAEFRLVRQLADGWVGSGGSLDSVSVWVVDDPAINAASMGRGIFVLWRGLEMLPEDDLDVVYAHEIAHDQLLHARKVADVADVTNFIGEALGTASGGGDEATSTLKTWSGAFVVPRYSRQQELEADARALTLLGSLGYQDPEDTMCQAFRRLRAAVGEAGGGFFDDHPALTERMAAIRQGHPSSAKADACR
jgi:Zn-dependent protease with chaperone function